MAFSMTAGNGGSGDGPTREQWDEWNQYLKDQIGKFKPRVAILSGIVDLGRQEQEDSVFEYKQEERQDKLLEEGKAYLSDDGKKIIRPRNPVQCVALMADFPSIEIDYSKHPRSTKSEPEIKPYRHLITGEFKGLADTLALSCKAEDGKWVYDPKHSVSKLAMAMDLVQGEYVAQDFNLGKLLGGAFSIQLGVNGKGYINSKEIGPIMDGVPIPEYDLEPFGVMFKGGNDGESLKQIRASVRKRMEMSPDWGESEIKKELEALKGNSSSGDSKPAKAEPVQEDTKKAKPAKAKPAKVAPEVNEGDDEDELPF